MIQVEPIQNLDGFGTGQSQTEYFYSQGMNRTQFGLTPNWNAADEATSATISGMALMNWFSSTVSNIYSVDVNGKVYGAPLSTLSWSEQYTPFISSHGNGLIVDQTGRVLIAGDRYLDKWDGLTANYSLGTLACNNGASTVVANSSTAFVSGMAGQQINIGGTLYTISSVSNATTLVLTAIFAGSTGNYPYTIYAGSVEQWQDFGSSFSTTGLRPMELYEDWVVIGNGNAIALLNVTDDSFNNEGLDLPAGYNVAALRAGQNGILVGINTNTKGAIFLWDAASNGSISQWIWFNSNIKAIIPTPEGYYGYYVITARGIYVTNGYLVQPLYVILPDDRVSLTGMFSALTPQSVTLVGNYLVFMVAPTRYNRQRSGLYIFNLNSNLFEFCPVSNQVTYNVGAGAVFYDGLSHIHFSYSTTLPNVAAIAQLNSGSPATAYFITDPKGLGDGKNSLAGNIKNAEAAKFTIIENPRQVGFVANTYNLALKVYNFERGLWSFAETNSISGGNTLSVNGTIFGGSPVAQVGDEVTILEGINAGSVAHITAIANQGLNTETWTLDTTFSNNTENNVHLSIAPFKFVKQFTFTNLSQFRDVYFDIGSKYQGKKFLLKLLLTNITGTEIDISDGQFVYTDKGVSTS